MRFTTGRKGVSPPAGFVGGPPVTRTRPNDVRSNLQGQGPEGSPTDENRFRLFTRKKRDTDTVSVSGSVMRFIGTPERIRIAGFPGSGDLAALMVTGDDSVIPNGPTLQYFQVGTAGNGYSLNFVSGTVNTGSIVDGPGPQSTFRFVFGVTTINDFQNRITSGSTFLTVLSSSSTPSAVLNSVSLDGGTITAIGGMNAIDGNLITSSLTLEGAVSMGRGYERRKLNQTVLGTGPWHIDQPPFPSKAVIDRFPTASFESPSWTRKSLGVNHGFVISNLTSSNFQEHVLNLFRSGTETLEASAAPASTPTYFSKERRFQTIVVKKTASLDDTVLRSGSWVSTGFFPGTGSIMTSVTGGPDFTLSTGTPTETNPNTHAPMSILIPVNASGRLVDIKIWLEWITVSGTGGDGALETFGAAIRAPNLSWGNAHPIRNDPQLKRIYTSNFNDYNISGDPNVARDFLGSDGTINSFYRDTFILWEGVKVFNPSFGPLNNFFGRTVPGMYPTWAADGGMRVVFTDNAGCPNPRHLLGKPPVLNYTGSPSSAVGFTTAFGAQVPWTSDQTIPGSAVYKAPGSPPRGWLTGIGGKAAENEWPTTGVNYGTSEIKPLYPLLDPIFQTKVQTFEVPPVTGTLISDPNVISLFRPDLWRGVRPGLRGTEISGSWELLISMFQCQQSYFRQVRLEITYETPSYSRPAVRSNSHRPQARKPGSYMASRISGSDGQIVGVLSADNRAGWDCFISENFATVSEDNAIGRTFGVNPLSGNFVTDGALAYRLSGALADLTGQTPGWLFSGPGGMPMIPESSASLVPQVAQAVVATSFTKFILPQRDLDSTQRLENVASDTNPALKLRDLAASFVSSSAI